MFDIVADLVRQGETLLILIVAVLVIVSVIQTYMRSRSWIPTLGVLLVGAVALWGVANVRDISDRVDEDIDIENPRTGALDGN